MSQPNSAAPRHSLGESMNFRPLILAASALALFISACSQVPTNLDAPVLAPQFGTAGTDAATVVASRASHSYIYVGGESFGTRSNREEDDIFLRRYNRDGSLAWERRSGQQGQVSGRQNVGTDATGNAYIAWRTRTPFPQSPTEARPYLSKLNPAGRLLWRKDLGAGLGILPVALTVDAVGNAYLTLVDYGDDYDQEGSYLRAYSPGGRLRWQREASRSLTLEDVTVADDGALYVTASDPSGRSPLLRYNTDGALLWEVALPQEGLNGVAVAVGGEAVYVGANTGSDIKLYRYNEDGALVWERTITPLDYAETSDVTADEDGNAYLTGYTDPTNMYDDPSGDDTLDLFVRKYTPAGSIAWTYKPRLTDTNEQAYRVEARTSGEVYVVGSTDGRVNGNNFGLSDAFAVRLNGTGKKVWSR